jgi:MoaA/NifB/PqqE/SkfB family radical SAM enzyme
MFERVYENDFSETLEVPTGSVCNNQGIFCAEQQDGTRQVDKERLTPDAVYRALEQHTGSREVIFGFAESTLNPNLPAYIRKARDLGFQRIGLISNGRRLADRELCMSLVDAGTNELVISVHGPTAEVHDALTMRQGSFSETWRGIQNFSEICSWRPGFKLCLSVVLNRVNLPYLEAMMSRFLSLNVTSVNFLSLILQGSALDHLDELAVPPAELAEAFRGAVAALPPGLDTRRIILSGLPFCVMAGIETFRAFSRRFSIVKEEDGEAKSWTVDKGHVKRESCLECGYEKFCPGVAPKYVERYGWDAFTPVTQIPVRVKRAIEEQMRVLGVMEEGACQRIEREIEALRVKFETSVDRPPGERADLAWQLATRHSQVGAADAAMDILREALRIEPYFIGAWLKLAEILLQKNDPSAARKTLLDAEKLPLTDVEREKLASLLRQAECAGNRK